MDDPRIGALALLGEAVADGEAGDAALGEVGAPVLEGVARAAPPVATVHIDDQRVRSGAGRKVEVAGQLDAVMVGVCDILLQFEALAGLVLHEIPRSGSAPAARPDKLRWRGDVPIL